MAESPQNRALQAFRDAFGEEPSNTFKAPGRVNLIGEHTDYNEGFVLPCAISFETVICCRKNDTNRIRVVAADYNCELDDFSLDLPIETTTHHWANYLRGIIAIFIKQGYKPQGVDIAVAGNIPQGAGLSSSASLEVCLAYALESLFEFGFDRKQLARIGQQAENEFVGCNCGIMDQLISACGEKESALLIDCRDLSTQAVSIPSDLTLLIIDPKVERKLVGSEYNVRRESCEEASRILQINSLRDANLILLDEHRDKLDDETFRRARHVISENERVIATVDAFKTNNLKAINTLLAASHASMRDDFEITTPELDFVADTINNTVEQRGGARMTGGGFGGCAVALVPNEQVETICQSLPLAYQAKFNKQLTIFKPEISDGVNTIQYTH